MKRIIMFFLAALVLFSACKKDDPVNNRDADGEYTVTEVEIDGEIYTGEDGIEGDVMVENEGTRINMYFEMDGWDEPIDVTEDIVVKRSGNRFDIYESDGETKVGDINGNVLELNLDDGETQVRIRAVK